ncbi:2-oxo-tetronate isomerase [Arthrobacter sp. LS16]|uniref:2-oxo-tetronate isomerase n=1 Tax=Arthrobacter sp. 'calajunan' TaxID=1690248 RepID=UPI003C739C52
MSNFAANLSMMFTELPFAERFQAAANAGFTAVEYLFPYELPAERIRGLLRENGLVQALFNAPAGTWEAGERGLAALEGREKEFHSSIELAIDYARILQCPRVHVMAGNAPVTPQATETYVGNLRHAADAAAAAGLQLSIEPINARDMPGYFLSGVPQALELLERIDRPNVGLQFDYYHAQITHGDVTMLMRGCIERITHVQIASVPERHEPDGGELNLNYVLGELHAAGYRGWIGCEYRPRTTTEAGLGWLHRVTASQP